MVSSSFDQQNTEPARVTEIPAALIDHICSNSNDRKISGVFDAGISDHHTSFAFITLRTLTKTNKHKFREHSDRCIDELEKSLIDIIL